MTIIAIDSNNFKVRIKALLEADTAFFDAANPKGKVREVRVGTPPNKDYKDLHHPAVVITDNERWMEEKHRGPDSGTVRTSVETTIRFDIVLVVQNEDAPAAEKEYNRLWKVLEETLYDHITLEAVGGGSPLCKDILFEHTRRIPQMQGQEIDGFIGTLKVLVDPNG